MQLEPVLNALLMEAMLARQPLGLFIQAEILHADGALDLLLELDLVYFDRGQLVKLVFGGRRRSSVFQLVEQLSDDRVKTARSPRVVSHVAVKLEHANWGLLNELNVGGRGHASWPSRQHVRKNVVDDSVGV